MEIYEILYSIPAGEIETGDLIRFRQETEDGTFYENVLRVSEVDYVADEVIVSGFSETDNDKETVNLLDSLEVEVLGG